MNYITMSLVVAAGIALLIAVTDSDDYKKVESLEYKMSHVKAFADCHTINAELMRKGIVLDENSVHFACKRYADQEADKAYSTK
ncbi:hypothetical protein JZU46_00880 [bacterium]|nr:hypothetical protein [bacterium]